MTQPQNLPTHTSEGLEKEGGDTSDLALEAATRHEEKLNDKKKKYLYEQLLSLCYQHFMLFLITYTGLIRFKKADLMTRVPSIFSHSFEVFAHGLPLLLIQMMNNKFLDKFDRPLDSTNLVLSILNFLAILAERGLTFYLSRLRVEYSIQEEAMPN